MRQPSKTRHVGFKVSDALIHINSSSGINDWRQGRALLTVLCDRLPRNGQGQMQKSQSTMRSPTIPSLRTTLKGCSYLKLDKVREKLGSPSVLVFISYAGKGMQQRILRSLGIGLQNLNLTEVRDDLLAPSLSAIPLLRFSLILSRCLVQENQVKSIADSI